MFLTGKTKKTIQCIKVMTIKSLEMNWRFVSTNSIATNIT